MKRLVCSVLTAPAGTAFFADEAAFLVDERFVTAVGTFDSGGLGAVFDVFQTPFILLIRLL